MVSGFACPLESQRTQAGNINGPSASLTVLEYTLLLEVSEQDLEKTCMSAESSAPCSLTLCPCLNPAQGLDHSPAQGICLSAPLQYHWRTSGCLTAPQCAEHLALDMGFLRVTLLLVQKIHTPLLINHIAFQGDEDHMEGDHPTQPKLQPPPVGCSRAKGNDRSCPAHLKSRNRYATTR